MKTTVTDEEGRVYEVDENGNIIDPNRRKFGPADPRVDPRATKRISLSELAKERATEEEVKTNTAAKTGTTGLKSYAPQGYDPGYSGDSTPPTTVNAPKGDSGTSGYETAGRINSGIAGLAGLYDLNRNRQAMGTGQGYIQGATSGAAIGTAIYPGVGTLIGAGLGAGYGSGSRWVAGTEGAIGGAQAGAMAGKYVPIIGPAIGSILGAIGGGFAGAALGKGVSRTKLEENKRQALKEKLGIDIPVNPAAPNGKEWELNPVFAETRNESDLTGVDIINAADWYAMVPGWAELNQEDKIATAQEAINQGAIREHHGGIDIDFENNPGFTAWVEQMMQAQKDPYRKIPYSEAFPMEYAAAQQARRQNIAGFAMSDLAADYQSPFGSSSISLDNPYLR